MSGTTCLGLGSGIKQLFMTRLLKKKAVLSGTVPKLPTAPHEKGGFLWSFLQPVSPWLWTMCL